MYQIKCKKNGIDVILFRKTNNHFITEYRVDWVLKIRKCKPKQMLGTGKDLHFRINCINWLLNYMYVKKNTENDHLKMNLKFENVTN